MWLVNVQTRNLELFNDVRNLPPYAILSHTWTGSEITMQQYQYAVASDDPRFDHIRTTQGYLKIEASCLQARAYHLPYVWIDTCCIDKTSSAELSEAINSMFRWYRLAQVCYAFLEDVEAAVSDRSGLANVDATVNTSQVAKSRWFTRGWTLQELIAPRYVQFYDKHWTCFGSKETMKVHLAQITGIDEDVLTGARSLDSISIARRMSWAAHRQTTKEEDLAYSLLGIFDINMPLLYGEGAKAFVRLQEEILREHDDQSLFAWQPDGADVLTPLREQALVNAQDGISVFATHPRNFISTADMRPFASWGNPPSTSSKGVRIELPLSLTAMQPTKDHKNRGFLERLAQGGRIGDAYIAPLSCTYGDDEAAHPAIIIQHVTQDQFVRHPTAGLVRIEHHHIRRPGVLAIILAKKISLIKGDPVSFEDHRRRNNNPVVGGDSFKAPKNVEFGMSTPNLTHSQ